MIETTLHYMIKFITHDIGLEKDVIEEHAEENIKRFLRLMFNHTKDISKFTSDAIQEYILELRKIRNVYQKGKSFVNNNTKGKKKGFLSRWYDIHEMSNDPEYSQKHLDWIKRNMSERTYYRHKKKLIELGLAVQ